MTARAHVPGTVADYVRSQGGRRISLREVVEQMGLSYPSAEHFLRHAVLMGELVVVEHRGRARYIPSGPTATDIAKRHLPVTPMRPGPGPRHRCEGESACLDAMMRAHPLATTAHCPINCPAYVAPAKVSGWVSGKSGLAAAQDYAPSFEDEGED